MSLSKHLGNTEELLLFLCTMNNQLDSHKKEKRGLRDDNYGDVSRLVLSEIEDRIKIIKSSNSTKVTEKQCVHIANYLMMLWIKARESEY